MDDVERVADLKRAFPDFAVTSWRPLGEGWMSRALLLNDAWVARFAKSEAASSDLQKEAAVLPAVAERVSLAVPRFELVGRQRSGLSFVVYRLLRGEPLAETLGELPAGRQERLAQQLAGFISELQSLPVHELAAARLPYADLRADVAEQYADWQQLRAEIPAELFDYTCRRFEQYLAEPGFRSERRCFIHADMSPDHWLFDAARGELSGIIDFGDCELGDPDCEYVYLLEDAGEAFTRRVLELQNSKNIEARLRKLRYLVTFDQVQGVLASSRYGKPEHREACLAALRDERDARAG